MSLGTPAEPETASAAARADDGRAARLPDALRSSLHVALVATFGDIPDDFDLDTVGLDLLEGVGWLLTTRAADIHRGRSVDH
jgi:hypothetical protein